jgi:hypothetical protein
MIGRATACLIGILLTAAWCAAAEPAALEKHRCPKPKRFALVFSFGYAGDLMPKEDARFDELLGKIKQAGFNVLHCTYSDRRLELCRKHGVQMMVDLLSEADHHVYKSPEKAKTTCEKLKNEPAVWGYNIWNDPVRKTGEGRRRDINTVRGWDPTHPAYSGTYRTEGLSHLVNADVLGYYDFHWKRGLSQHFPHLLAFRNAARERDAWFYSWLAATSGQPGKGNFNRCLWSANTAIACGQKGILWFLATELMNPKTLEWTEVGGDIQKVHRELAPLVDELPRLGNAAAVWSTPITKTANNEPLPDGPKATLPPGLEKQGFPKDAWLQPLQGEFLVGVFEDAARRRFAFIANHNAYAEQPVALKTTPVRVELFDRKTGAWRPLEVKEGTVALQLGPGGGALLRFEDAGLP